MDKHPHSILLSVLGAITLAFFALGTGMTDFESLLGPSTQAAVGLVAFVVAGGAGIVWFLLAIRPLWHSGKTKVPGGMLLRQEFNPKHDPSRTDAPWRFVCHMVPLKRFSPATFQVKTTESPLRVKAFVEHHGRALELIQLHGGISGRFEPDKKEVTTKATLCKIENRAVTLRFHLDQISLRDTVTVVAESNSPTLRISRVKWLRKGAANPPATPQSPNSS